MESKLDRNSIKEQITEIFSRNLGVDSEKITEESHLVNDLGIDSFASLEIIFEIEKRFSIDVPGEAFGEIKTVSDVIEYVATHLNND